MVELQSIYSSSYIIYVHKLSVEPLHYFVLENPDAYVLKAISTQNYVNVGSPNNTQLYDLIQAHPGESIEYNGTYYSAGCLFKTDSPTLTSFSVILAEIVISVSGMVTIASLKTINYVRNKPN